MIFASHPFGLNPHGRFIGLDIVSGQQLLRHGPADGPQQFTDPHHPAIQSRPGQFNPGLPFQNRALAIERHMVSVFADHCVDDHPIAGQTFLDNPWRQRRGLDSLLFTSFTGSFLAFGHPHEVFRRFDIELLGRLVTDLNGLLATVAADALFRGASNDLFDSGQIRRQFLPARMRAHRPER